MSIEQNVTNDIKAYNEKVSVLKTHFAHCFDKNGKLDIAKFKQELSVNEVDISKEGYSLDWLGKSYARLLAGDEVKTLLNEEVNFNEKEENKTSHNLLIKGDNLEVLKHLSNAYYEQIKMIYIDPPYNTGNDGFAYQDDRKFTIEELQTLAGIDKEKAKRILDFTNSKSNSHSAWLTFMYPRLYIAKELLKEEGVIFISIDDNEASQLKIMLDEEIFGEENFIAKVPVVTNLKGNQDEFGFAGTHEYFLVYAKNKDKCELNNFNVEEEELLKSWEEDEYGYYKKGANLKATGQNGPREKRQNLYYPLLFKDDEIHNISIDEYEPIYDKETKDFNDDYVEELKLKYESLGYTFILPTSNGQKMSWRWQLSKMINEPHNIIVSESEDGISIYKKQRPELGELPSKKPKSTFYKPEYSSGNGTNHLKNLFGKKIFKGPKPVSLIMDLLTIGMNKEDIVLDFFGGSGTTGEAVMRLNVDDSGNRKFIMVQLPELLDPVKNKEAYDYVKDELKISTPTVFDITKQRLILASKQIRVTYSDTDKQDLGFKLFTTIPIWDDYGFDSNELTAQTKLFDESKLLDEDIKAILVTWKTNDGSQLIETFTEYDLDGFTGYYIAGKLYLMNKGFTTKNLKALLEKIDSDKNFNPTSIIAFGYHFESKSLREISENIKSYANKKSIDIDFITRY